MFFSAVPRRANPSKPRVHAFPRPVKIHARIPGIRGLHRIHPTNQLPMSASQSSHPPTTAAAIPHHSPEHEGEGSPTRKPPSCLAVATRESIPCPPEPEPDGPWWVLYPADFLRLLDRWPLLRHLALERWFRWSCVALFLLVSTLALGLPRIWIVTPRGCTPVIRVSGVDGLQARWHRDRSEAAWNRGDSETAIFEWRQALANQPASIPILRGGLDRLSRQPSRDPARFRVAVGNTLWLLQLTRTNRSDVARAMRVFESFGVDDLLLATARNLSGKPSPHEYAAVLKARFRAGDVEGFAAGWRGFTGNAGLDAELELYHAAWLAGWGKPEEALTAERRLIAAEADSRTRELALRLCLLVLARRGDLARFETTLGDLEDMHASAAIYHVALWRLMASRGRVDEARRRAVQFAGRPVSSLEVRRLAEAYLELGLEDSALNLMDRMVPELGVAPDLWVYHVRELQRRERWDEVRWVSLLMRYSPLLRHSLDGYSHYLEGLYQLSRRGSEAAAAAFRRAAENPTRDASLALEMAGQMIRLGHTGPAQRLLLTREVELDHSPEYWGMLCRTAFAERDVDLLLKAARRHWQLRPDDAGAMNTLAAALIVRHSETELLLYLTKRVFETNPELLPARLNRASALLQAGRKAEARALLSLVDDTQGLPPAERTMIRLARTEQLAADGDAIGALAAVRDLNPEFLLPEQVVRIGQIRREMERRVRGRL